MGACLTLERDEVIARKRSDEIDKQLDALAKERPRILKILLLGAGESGKYNHHQSAYFRSYAPAVNSGDPVILQAKAHG